ncbi:GNAT family N-acetyltransferase [Neobacillus sp.]|uniref:GNAT family N-acetyltransferase n=1 Tax=Neobacillus sp. TaxID=2675273 RepID=UPI00289F9A3D|nr:GNAT family N-acetyltransferase [Neobacillus sp.]
MDVISRDHWDEALWQKAVIIYIEAFGEHGGKPVKIIRNMFEKQLCALHVAMIGNEVVAMALTGAIQYSRILLIDYLAVRKDVRGQGVGQDFVHKITKWALAKDAYNFVLLEAM